MLVVCYCWTKWRSCSLDWRPFKLLVLFWNFADARFEAPFLILPAFCGNCFKLFTSKRSLQFSAVRRAKFFCLSWKCNIHFILGVYWQEKVRKDSSRTSPVTWNISVCQKLISSFRRMCRTHCKSPHKKAGGGEEKKGVFESDTFVFYPATLRRTSGLNFSPTRAVRRVDTLNYRSAEKALWDIVGFKVWNNSGISTENVCLVFRTMKWNWCNSVTVVSFFPSPVFWDLVSPKNSKYCVGCNWCYYCGYLLTFFKFFLRVWFRKLLCGKT